MPAVAGREETQSVMTPVILPFPKEEIAGIVLILLSCIPVLRKENLDLIV